AARTCAWREVRLCALEFSRRPSLRGHHRPTFSDIGFLDGRGPAGAKGSASRRDRGGIPSQRRLQSRRIHPGVFHKLHVVPALSRPGHVVEKEGESWISWTNKRASMRVGIGTRGRIHAACRTSQKSN